MSLETLPFPLLNGYAGSGDLLVIWGRGQGAARHAYGYRAAVSRGGIWSERSRSSGILEGERGELACAVLQRLNPQSPPFNSTNINSDAPGLASSPEAPKPKPWLDKPSQAKSLASGGLGLGLGVTEAQSKGSSRGLEGGK
ncbi:hypothetical protein DFH08DRAFT_821390 [Mycena albidolilacea]|uniref:Uncharacterized protein n=1 Tax=Mycena albidolilacea TaxID=1033008 RepID=A0AAD6ZAT7_9AGAR|nr:hypothetical protein DFH08DRAFT_821390 [Mycena albidolilacea]